MCSFYYFEEQRLGFENYGKSHIFTIKNNDNWTFLLIFFVFTVDYILYD